MNCAKTATSIEGKIRMEQLCKCKREQCVVAKYQRGGANEERRGIKKNMLEGRKVA